MKNVVDLGFIFCFVGIPSPSFAQLEVIDKIASVLIPGITSGIKSVLESSKGDKVSKDEVKQLKVAIMNDVGQLISSLNSDVSNMNALNDIFLISGALYDDIGAMKSLTNDKFIEEIYNSQNHHLMRETAILFAFEWNQVLAKKTKLVDITRNAVSGSIQDDIDGYAQNLDENLIDLETALGLSKNPSLDMDMEASKLYIDKMRRAYTYIDAIEDEVNQINTQLSSRIRTFKLSLERTKSALEDIANE